MRPWPRLIILMCLSLLGFATMGPAEATGLLGLETSSATDTLTTVGHSSLDIAPNSTKTGFVYCSSGNVPSINGRLAGGWTVRVTGVRGGVPYTQPDDTGAGATYDDCGSVSTAGTDAGFFVIDLSYMAVGGSVIAHSTGIATWNPVEGYHTASFDFTP